MYFEQNVNAKGVNPFSANPAKWSNTLKRIVWVCLTILWYLLLKGLNKIL